MGNSRLKRHIAMACAVALASQAPFASLQALAGASSDPSGTSEIAKRIEAKFLETKSLDQAKDLVLDEEFSKIPSVSFAKRLKDAGVAVSDTQKASAVLRKSVAKESAGIVRLYVRSTESSDRLKELFGNFGEVSVKEFSDDSYELKFPDSGRIGKTIAKDLASGTLPASLPAGVEIIQPSYLQATVSTGAYLAWENLANMWGQTKTAATDYQYGLSQQGKVRVGIIDTGILTTHSDLAQNVWKNPNEIAGNGIDDDGNGYADDVYGYNFIANTGNATDDHGHGTHVAGIVGSNVNWAGSFGTDSNASLVALKVLDASGAGSSYDIAEAVNYAANNGIPVINLSLGGNGTPSNDMMCNAITAARAKGTIAVVAAGNENADVSRKVPAGCKDAVTVWAVDSNLTKASFSNYGAEVDVAAPGVSIYSTYYNGGYALMSWTSMASPFVAGLAAAIKAHRPSYGPNEIYSVLKNDATTVPVTSSVNIGKFVRMDKEMQYLWVANDVDWGTSVPQNQPPSVSVNAVSVGTNSYRIDTSASDVDGTVTRYEYWNGSTLLASGSDLASYSLTVTQNTTVTVRVYDDMGASASVQVPLAYVAPVANSAPSLSLSVKKYAAYNRLNISSTDTDGLVSKIEVYVNGTLQTTAIPNVKTYAGYVDFKKGVRYSVSVISYDDKWATTKKSVTIK